MLRTTPSLSKTGLLLYALCTLCYVTGCAPIYHFTHYHAPFKRLSDRHRTYYQNSRTGRILAKDEGCRTYCEPDCFGYESTCWSPWPEHCLNCPQPDSDLSAPMAHEPQPHSDSLTVDELIVRRLSPALDSPTVPASNGDSRRQTAEQLLVELSKHSDHLQPATAARAALAGGGREPAGFPSTDTASEMELGPAFEALNLDFDGEAATAAPGQESPAASPADTTLPSLEKDVLRGAAPSHVAAEAQPSSARQPSGDDFNAGWVNLVTAVPSAAEPSAAVPFGESAFPALEQATSGAVSSPRAGAGNAAAETPALTEPRPGRQGTDRQTGSVGSGPHQSATEPVLHRLKLPVQAVNHSSLLFVGEAQEPATRESPGRPARTTGTVVRILP